MIDLKKYELYFHKIANKYKNQGTDYEDLLQICRLEAFLLSKKFDARKSNFLTFLYAGLERRVRRYHNNVNRPIRFPEHLLSAKSKISLEVLPGVVDLGLTEIQGILDTADYIPDFSDTLDSLIDATDFLEEIDYKGLSESLTKAGLNRKKRVKVFKQLGLKPTFANGGFYE